jgi:serine/threonine-protein kinase
VPVSSSRSGPGPERSDAAALRAERGALVPERSDTMPVSSSRSGPGPERSGAVALRAERGTLVPEPSDTVPVPVEVDGARPDLTSPSGLEAPRRPKSRAGVAFAVAGVIAVAGAAGVFALLRSPGKPAPQPGPAIAAPEQPAAPPPAPAGGVRLAENGVTPPAEARAPLPGTLASAPPAAPASAEPPPQANPEAPPSATPEAPADELPGPRDEVRPGRRPAKKVRPATQSASLVISSTPAGTIRVNGDYLGKSPVQVKAVPPGEIRVDVAGDGFHRTEIFRVAPGNNPPRNVVVAKVSLKIRAGPGDVQVAVDGKPEGLAPVTVTLYEGAHRIQFTEVESRRTETKVYVVKPGNTAPLTFLFSER